MFTLKKLTRTDSRVWIVSHFCLCACLLQAAHRLAATQQQATQIEPVLSRATRVTCRWHTAKGRCIAHGHGGYHKNRWCAFPVCHSMCDSSFNSFSSAAVESTDAVKRLPTPALVDSMDIETRSQQTGSSLLNHEYWWAGHTILVRISCAVRSYSHCAKICRFLIFVFPVKFDINMRKQRRFMPQQVVDEIFADKDRDYDPDQMKHRSSRTKKIKTKQTTKQ